jgi:1,4-dihydroxy-2-naphthoate octaprenyltransferase
MRDLKYLLGPMRLPFVVLAPACVLLGIAAAVFTAGRVSLLYALLTLIGGVSAHISVNAFNEYFDFKSGLDARTRRTPFSGGSGTLQARPDLAPNTLGVALATLAITGLIGAYFLAIRGLGLLPLGILGVLVIVIYTPWLALSPILCLVAPGLGFGTLMVMGTSYVLTGYYSWVAFAASLVPFFLVSDLLLLNQFPDVEADRSIGRRHLPIVAGRKTSSWVYAGFLLGAYLAIGIAVILGLFPALTLLAWLLVPLAVVVAIGAVRFADDLGKLAPYLGLNVILNLATPVLAAIGLFLG